MKVWHYVLLIIAVLGSVAYYVGDNSSAPDHSPAYSVSVVDDNAAAEADYKASHEGIKPCVNEDASLPGGKYQEYCYWDASQHGDGTGRSFTSYSFGETIVFWDNGEIKTFR